MKLNLSKKIAVALVGMAVIGAGTYLIAADHIDAPAVTGTSSDITDVYAFESPESSDNMVFVVNTQGLLSPANTGAAHFDSDVMLEINIDNSATKDHVEDLVIQVTFENGKVQVYGPVAPNQTGLTGTLVSGGLKVEGEITAYNASAVVKTGNGVTVFAGPRDDPFFFDLDQYHKVIAGDTTAFRATGVDAFKGTNVMATVVEVPKSTLGTGPIDIWVTSNRKK